MQLGHEHLSAGIECDDDLSEAGMFKTNNEVKRVGPLDLPSFMQVSDQSTLRDKPGTYGSYSDVDNLINSDQNGHKVAPCSLPPPPFEIVKTETEFYTDKVVTEMELPKMIVCYKEGSYHIIKDICVDEGLHSFDSVLVQNPFLDEKVYTESKLDTDNFTHKEISDSLKSLHLNRQPTFEAGNEVTECAALEIAQEEGGFISRPMGETVSCETQKVNFNEVFIPTQDLARCQCQEEIIHTHNENATECSLASLLELDRGSTGTAEEIEHAPGTKELVPLHELDREHCHDNLPSCQSGIKQPQLVINDSELPKSGNNDAENLAKESRSNEAVSHQLKSLTNSCLDFSSTSVSTSQTFYVFEGSSGDQVDEGTFEDANSPTAHVSSEKVKEEVIAKYSPNFGSSGGTIVAFDIDSDPPTTIPGQASKGTSEIQQSELVMSGGLLESTSTDGPTVASQHSFSHGHSDAKFCGRASLSGHISSGGTIVAFDIDSEPLTTIPEKDSEETSEIQQSELVMSGGLLESTSSDGPTVASQPSSRHGHSDANFPGRASLSGRIAYSGQIPYSGSVSLRSDSSTTSTRSFAFPILQSEWNSSPVRMAKADRRHFRRRQGWRSGLLCCRF